ncbi:MAG: cysteine--tRNA ligase [Flavobacteriales bacterium]|jgi:cysteinyl-tRNA synthetase|nr:cysteine--tRNA ligase [Flavobacteriales bacterium]
MEQTLYIYNSITREKEKFSSIIPGHVGMYVCGPTVYSDVHLGNVRTFLTFDMVRRYLEFIGYKVRYVRNITDVGHLTGDSDDGEDKIAKKAKLENLEPMEVVQKYTNGFHDVMTIFNIGRPSIEPTATGHIIEQIEMIQDIISNGFAYVSNGSVYFDVRKFSEKFNYGKLSGRVIDDLLSNTRDLDGQDEKRDGLDFALWKKAEPQHLMRWNSPWGEGFPGWHIECSVMSTKYLGKEFDIHGGGMDLKFPHHECEIAQNVGATGHEPVRYWMHGNMLTVNGRKMAKSEGNGFTPEELITGNHKLLERGYTPMTVRFFFLMGHYASTLDFSNEALQAAERGYKRMTAAIQTLKQVTPSEKSDFDASKLREACYAAMNDDFNTPVLISELFEAVRVINSAKEGSIKLSAEQIEALTQIFQDFFYAVMGMKDEEGSGTSELTESLMQMIIGMRADAKANKDYATSDKLRDALAKIHVQIKDTKEGATWSYEG